MSLFVGDLVAIACGVAFVALGLWARQDEAHLARMTRLYLRRRVWPRPSPEKARKMAELNGATGVVVGGLMLAVGVVALLVNLYRAIF